MMCFALYIGTDRPLATSEWSEERRQFYLAALSERDEVVRHHFSKHNVYYAGSHLQCGCGFFQNSLVFTDDQDMMRSYEESQQSARALVEVIQRALATSDSVELFVTWEGRQGEPPERTRDMVPQQLMSPLERYSDDADDEVREAHSLIEEQDFIVFHRDWIVEQPAGADPAGRGVAQP